jgi:hypothetical protein
MIFQSFNLLENREKGKREKDDVSPDVDDVSPRVDVILTSADGGRLGNEGRRRYGPRRRDWRAPTRKGRKEKLNGTHPDSRR